MSRRRFTIEELEAIAVKEKLAMSTKRSLLRELDNFIHHGVLLIACIFKQSASEDPTADSRLPPPGPKQDRLLRPERAAETFGTSRQFFYDHEPKLPFVVRLPNGVLRVSENKMLEWIEEQSDTWRDPETPEAPTRGSRKPRNSDRSTYGIPAKQLERERKD